MGGDGAPSVKLSPIESVFQRHMAGSLAGYSAILADLDAKLDRRKQDVFTQYSARIDGIRAAHKVALKLRLLCPWRRVHTHQCIV